MKYHHHHDPAEEAWELPNTQKLANAIAGLAKGTYENPNQAAKATGASSATIGRRMRAGKTQRQKQNLDSRGGICPHIVR